MSIRMRKWWVRGRSIVLQSLISPSKGNEKRKSYNHAGYSFLVTHPGTNPAKQGRRHVVLSLWYSDTERIFFLISKMRKGNKERKKSLILAGKIKSKTNERNENENYYLFWLSHDKQALRSLSLSRSLGPITSWMFYTTKSPWHYPRQQCLLSNII